MEPLSAEATPYFLFLALSVVLLLFHVLLQAMLATRELGSHWNAGPRDEEKKPASALAGRANRASVNYRETYPAFVGLILALILRGDASGFGLIGASLWTLCRIGYIPLYLAGIAYIRSFVWLGAILCLGIMMIALFL